MLLRFTRKKRRGGDGTSRKRGRPSLTTNSQPPLKKAKTEKSTRTKPSVIKKIKIDPKVLCVLAKSDAKHDFKNYDEEIVKETLPSIVECADASPEDTFLNKYLNITRDANNYFKINENHSNKIINVKEEYDEYLIKKGELFDKTGESKLSQFLKKQGLNEIYLIVDTYKESFRDSLTAKKNDDLGIKYYWLQNKQTLYDPAGKTNDKTSAGKGIFTDNINTVFCWESNNSLYEFYPQWSNKIENKNQLFYSKNDIYQVLKSKDPNNYISQESVCIMKVGKNAVVMNKEMSKISGAIFSKGSYTQLYNYIKDTFKKLYPSVPVSIPNIPISFSDVHHYVAKRLGDQGQALSCLNSVFTYKYRVDKQVKENVSNGNHCFVTIDRLALAAALLYRVPIIIFNYQQGGLHIFINKKLISEERRIQIEEEAELKMEGLISDLNTKIKEKVEILNEEIDNIQKIILIISTEIQKILNKNENKNIKNDDVYRVFVKDLLQYVPIMNIIKNLSRYEFISGSRIENTQKYIDALQRDLKNIEKMIDERQKFIEKHIDNYKIVIDNKTIKNINSSALFTTSTGSERIFVSKKEMFSLALYLKEISDALYGFDEGNKLLNTFITHINKLLLNIQKSSMEFKATLFDHIKKTLKLNMSGGDLITNVNDYKDIVYNNKYISIITKFHKISDKYDSEEFIKTFLALGILAKSLGIKIYYKQIPLITLKSIDDDIINIFIFLNKSINSSNSINSEEGAYYIDFVENQIEHYDILKYLYYSILNEYNHSVENNHKEYPIFIDGSISEFVSEYINEFKKYIATPEKEKNKLLINASNNIIRRSSQKTIKRRSSQKTIKRRSSHKTFRKPSYKIKYKPSTHMTVSQFDQEIL